MPRISARGGPGTPRLGSSGVSGSGGSCASDRPAGAAAGWAWSGPAAHPCPRPRRAALPRSGADRGADASGHTPGRDPRQHGGAGRAHRQFGQTGLCQCLGTITSAPPSRGSENSHKPLCLLSCPAPASRPPAAVASGSGFRPLIALCGRNPPCDARPHGPRRSPCLARHRHPVDQPARRPPGPRPPGAGRRAAGAVGPRRGLCYPRPWRRHPPRLPLGLAALRRWCAAWAASRSPATPTPSRCTSCAAPTAASACQPMRVHLAAIQAAHRLAGLPSTCATPAWSWSSRASPGRRASARRQAAPPGPGNCADAGHPAGRRHPARRP